MRAERSMGNAALDARNRDLLDARNRDVLDARNGDAQEARSEGAQSARAAHSHPEHPAPSAAARKRSNPWGRGGTRDPFSYWGKNWLVWRIGRRHLRTVAHLARGRTIDIGCGGQPMRPVFESRVGPIIGLDNPRSRHAEDPVQVFGTAVALPFRDGSFSTALCLQVLEHISEPEICLREACRVLEEGGHLLLTAPHMWHVHDPEHDYFRFTGHGLAHLFRKAGFEIVEIRPMAGYFVTAGARFAYFLAHFDRAGIGLVIRPLMFLVQAFSYGLDRIWCDRSETWNYLAVGRKPVRKEP